MMMTPFSITAKNGCLLGLITVAGLFITPSVFAQTIIPSNDGTGTLVMPNGQQFDITGGTLSGDGANLFHSFQEFGLNANQIANFLSNPTIQNILSRVNGGNPSVINGLIQVMGGNANLFIMNPSGIVFGPNAALNVGGDFTATTATGIGFNGGWFNAFGANNYTTLTGAPQSFVFNTEQPGVIINAGDLEVATGQNISFIAGTVVNTGNVTAKEGQVIIQAVPGSSLVRLSLPGHKLSVEVNLPKDGNGNPLPITPRQLADLLTGNYVNPAINTGLAVNSNGNVVLSSSGAVIPSQAGTSFIAGNIDVSGNVGGSVEILGNDVRLQGANIDLSGLNGGGIALIGGNFYGQGTQLNSNNTLVDNATVINANGVNNGDGGSVAVWSDGSTIFNGIITAKGGILSGNGGFVEISGKQSVTIPSLSQQVDLSAVNGLVGTLLLDPNDITIQAGTTGGIGGSPINTNTLGSADIGDFLNNNGSLIIATTGTGGVGDITQVAGANINWTSGSSLTLNADNSITLNAPISGGGNLILNAVGVTTINQSINVNSLTTDVNGITSINGGSINTTSDQIYNDSVEIQSPTNLTTTNSNVNFNNTLNSQIGESNNLNLSVGLGNINFIGDIGQTTRLGNLNVISGNNVTANAITASSITQTNGSGTTTFNGAVNTNTATGINLNGNNFVLNSDVTAINGGKVDITGVGNIQTTNINANAGINLTSNGGNINTTAGILQTSLSNDGGQVNIRATQNINTSNINSNPGININSTQGSVETANLNSAGDVGGDIEINAFNNITTANLNTNSANNRAGEVRINSQNGAVSTNNINTSGNIGNNVNIQAQNNINTANINASSSNNQGASITLTSNNGSVTTGNLNTTGNSGGNIKIKVENSITTGTINSSGSVGDGGNVTLDPTGDIEVVYINAEGGEEGNGGTVDITTGQRFRATGTFTNRDDLNTSISTAGGTGGGEVTINFNNGVTSFIVGPGLNFRDTNNGTIGLIANGINADNILENVVFPAGETVTIRAFQSNSLEDFQQFSSLFAESVQTTDFQTSIEALEAQRTQEFERFLGKKLPRPLTLAEIKDELKKNEEKTQVKTGVVYLNAEFAPISESCKHLTNLTKNSFDRDPSAFLSLLVVTADAEFCIQLKDENGQPLTYDKIGSHKISTNYRSEKYDRQQGKPILGETTKNDTLINTFYEFVSGSENIKNVAYNPTLYREFSQKLYDLLIRPLEAKLQEENIQLDNLLFIMPSGLRRLPIAALYDKETKQFLIEKYSLAITPNFSSISSQYESLDGATIQAMGASEFQPIESILSDPLPAVELELNTIAHIISDKELPIFLDEDFTQAALQTVLNERQEAINPEQSFEILHLATHGNFKDKENSYIRVYDDKLTFQEFFSLSLKGLELLTLSACQTATGEGNEEAELGFASLALQTDAKSVTASLWNVFDTGVVVLMTEFYNRLIHPEDYNIDTPLIKAEALRQAQIAMIKGEVKIENGRLVGSTVDLELSTGLIENLIGFEDLSHPYFWSAFTLVGSPW